MFVPRVLIVDDEGLEPMLPRDRYVCELAPNADRGLEMLERVTFDVVIVEVSADASCGVALLDRLKRERPALSVILVSATGGVREAVDAIKRGASHYLTKPCSALELRGAVDDAVSTRRRCAATPSDGVGLIPAPEVERSRAALEAHRAAGCQSDATMDLIGAGPAMSTLQEMIDLVAASSAPVLITGESGAGKELVARALHARSSRRAQPFIAVNTSAIPDALLEAEIFGYARGGFTGATQPRKGLLTEASGGTLMLDEIGDMQVGLQAKLLRVLQFGEVRPVGSDRAHHVDVRVIAATHRDLPSLIREGRFREDLYFRLDVLPITVPPLRERREDIPALVAHFLAEARSRSPGSPVRSIEADALELLRAAPWPGNVRELASVVERLVVLGREEKVEARHLSFLAARSHVQPRQLPSASLPVDASWTLRRLMQEYTEQVLTQTGGNKQRAAEILDVDQSTLYRWQRNRKGSQDEGLDALEERGGRAARESAAPRARAARRSREPAPRSARCPSVGGVADDG